MHAFSVFFFTQLFPVPAGANLFKTSKLALPCPMRVHQTDENYEKTVLPRNVIYDSPNMNARAPSDNTWARRGARGKVCEGRRGSRGTRARACAPTPTHLGRSERWRARPRPRMYFYLKKANGSAHRCKSVDCTCAAEVGPDSHAVRACARTYWGPSAF